MESNHRRAGLQPAALPAELPVHQQKKAPVDLNQPGLLSGLSSGRFGVAPSSRIVSGRLNASARFYPLEKRDEAARLTAVCMARARIDAAPATAGSE